MKKIILVGVFMACIFVFLFAFEGFIDSGQNLGNSNSIKMALGDVDGDGDLDAYIANSGQSNKLWINDGSGNFIIDKGQDLGDPGSYDVELGDLDGDGDLDAFVAVPASNRVWKNDGNGNFTDTNQSVGSCSSPVHVELGDIDGDGDLDVFISIYAAEPNQVWINDGNGFFTDSGQRLSNEWSVEVKFGDVDSDGDLDAFVANYIGGTRVWFNDGNGTFSSGPSIFSMEAHDVALGDLDNDGDIDAFVTNFWQGSSPPNRVFFNDGNGNFSDSGQSLGNQRSGSVDLGDLDGDGDLDAFVGNGSWGGTDPTNKVWLNDGNGNFSDSGQILGDSNSSDVKLGDLDKDGDLDAFVANGSAQPNKVYLNQTIPHPDIQANDSDGPISITQSDTLQIKISLKTNGLTASADWWLTQKTASGWYHFNKKTKSWDPGLDVTHQGALFDLNPKKVFQSSGLSPGTYRFFFGVDMNMNGILTKSCLYYDIVKVTVTN